MTSLTAGVLTLAAPANVAQIIVARLVAEHDAAGRRAERDRIARTAVRAALWFAAGVTVAGALLAQPLAAFFHVSSVWPIVVSAASLGLYAVITVQRGVLQGAHRFGQFSASYCVESVLRTGVGVALAPAYGALGALIGLLAGVAVCYVYDELVLRTPQGGDDVREDAPDTDIAYVAWRIGVAQLMLTALSFYDVIVARHVFGAHDAGLYASAALVGRVMIGLLAFVPTVVMPKTTSRASAGRSTRALFAGALGIGAAIAVPGCIVAALFPEQIVTLFAGRAFAAAAPIVPLYAGAAAALGLANIVASYQFGLHRYRFVGAATAAGLLEIVVLCAWHPPPVAMAGVLLAGHCCVLAVSFIGLSR
jgi:O-antigen/teichoic acid export membrane protein